MALKLGDKKAMNSVDLENQGIWVEVDAYLQEVLDYYAELPETTDAIEEDQPVFFIKIRKFGAPKLKPQQRAISRRYNLGKGKQVEAMNSDLMANVIVADWSGVVDENEEPMECTPDNILKFINNPEYQWLRVIIDSTAGTPRLYRPDNLVDLGKSSGSGSSGKSSGATKKKT